MSYTLDTITVRIAYSAAGNVKLTQTVVNAVAALGRVRAVMTAADVAHIVNAKLHRDEQVTITQVERALAEMVRATGRGERYSGLRKGLYAVGMGFYDYR